MSTAAAAAAANAHRRVLSVGQCNIDHGQNSRVLRGTFAADVVTAGTIQEALSRLRQESFALVLVNRVFDLDGASGLELIRQVKNDETLNKVPIMLVSNYDDAQSEAVKAGALPGFGKGALHQPETAEKLKAVLG